jgi:hypothetical protein
LRGGFPFWNDNSAALLVHVLAPDADADDLTQARRGHQSKPDQFRHMDFLPLAGLPIGNQRI